MTDKEKWMRKTLIYLYEYFEGDNAKIIDEFCSNKLFKEGKTDPITIDKFFKTHKIKVTDYVTMLDDGFTGNQDPIHPILVYKKQQEENNANTN